MNGIPLTLSRKKHKQKKKKTNKRKHQCFKVIPPCSLGQGPVEETCHVSESMGELFPIFASMAPKLNAEFMGRIACR